MRVAGWLLALGLAHALAGCGSVQRQSDADQRRERLAGLDERAQRAVGRGEIGRAAALYGEALRIAESIEDFGAIGLYSVNLAATYQALDRFGPARAALDRVLASPARFDPQVVIEAAGRRALIALQTGELDTAAEWLGRAEVDCVPPACRIRVALLNMRGQLMLERGAAAQVRAYMPQVLAAARAEGNREEEANALRLDGRAASRVGEYGQAVAVLEQALELDKQLALPRKIALDLTALAETALARGDRAAARDYGQRALAVSRAAGSESQRDAAQRLLEKIP
jgi:tetratricopeptide (TPR) repeat protein